MRSIASYAVQREIPNKRKIELAKLMAPMADSIGGHGFPPMLEKTRGYPDFTVTYHFGSRNRVFVLCFEDGEKLVLKKFRHKEHQITETYAFKALKGSITPRLFAETGDAIVREYAHGERASNIVLESATATEIAFLFGYAQGVLSDGLPLPVLDYEEKMRTGLFARLESLGFGETVRALSPVIGCASCLLGGRERLIDLDMNLGNVIILGANNTPAFIDLETDHVAADLFSVAKLMEFYHSTMANVSKAELFEAWAEGVRASTGLQLRMDEATAEVFMHASIFRHLSSINTTFKKLGALKAAACLPPHEFLLKESELLAKLNLRFARLLELFEENYPSLKGCVGDFYDYCKKAYRL